MRRKLLFVTLVLCVAGCERIAASDAAEEEEQIEATEAARAHEAAVHAVAHRVPTGFPLPIMPGAEITASDTLNGPGGSEILQVSFRTNEAPQRISDFYARALREKAMKVSREDSQRHRTSQTMLIASSPQGDATILITREGIEPESTGMITWTTKKPSEK